MKFLVDANVLSEATKPSPSPEVLEWLRSNESQLTIDAIVLGELRYGILLLPKGKRRTRLETWLDEGVRRMHCLPWDADTGLRWARLLADLRRAGSSVPIKDSMIAATELTHGLAVVTRNQSDFAKTGVEWINPFPDK